MEKRAHLQERKSPPLRRKGLEREEHLQHQEKLLTGLSSRRLEEELWQHKQSWSKLVIATSFYACNIQGILLMQWLVLISYLVIKVKDRLTKTIITQYLCRSDSTQECMKEPAKFHF